MDKEKNSQVARAFALGGEIVTSIFLSIFLGLFLDEKFDISPVGILGGVFLGIGASFAILLRFGVSKK